MARNAFDVASQGIRAAAQNIALQGLLYLGAGGGDQFVVTAGIGSSETFGAHRMNFALSLGGIASAQVFGSVVLQAETFVLPAGLSTAESFGAPGVQMVLRIDVVSIVSAEAVSRPPFVGDSSKIVPIEWQVVERPTTWLIPARKKSWSMH